MCVCVCDSVCVRVRGACVCVCVCEWRGEFNQVVLVSSSIGFHRLFLHYILPLQNNFFIMPYLITRFLSFYLQSRATPGISASVQYNIYKEPMEEKGKVIARKRPSNLMH
jgi:hypothetical protein